MAIIHNGGVRGGALLLALMFASAMFASAGCPADNGGLTTGAGGSGGGLSVGGSGGTSSVMCAPGTADCNGDASDGCEIDTTDDSDHCGHCGHDCLGTICYASVCEPQVVWSNAEVTSVALNDEYLFWSTATRQLFLAKKGTTDGALGFNSADITTKRAGTVAVVDDVVMYGTQPYLVQVKIGMPPAVPLILSVEVGALAFDGTSVVWWDNGAKALRWTSVDGMQATTLTSPTLNDGTAVAVASGIVYAADAMSVQRIDLVDDTAEPFVEQGARQLWLDGGSLFMLTDEMQPRLLRVALSDGSSEVIYDATAVTSFAITDDAAVVATEEALLLKPLDGGATQLVYRRPNDKPQWPDHSVVSLALDGTHVYWATPDAAGHHVARIAR